MSGEEIALAEIEMQRLMLEAKDRYMDYLEALQKVYLAEQNLEQAREEE